MQLAIIKVNYLTIEIPSQTHLLSLAGDVDGLDVVCLVAQFSDAKSAGGSLAAEAVLGEGLLVLPADGLPLLGGAARLDQRVLGQRSAGGVGQLAAGVAVANLALLADQGSDLGIGLAHLAAEGLAGAKAIHNGLHGAVGGQIPNASVVEEDELAAERTGETVGGSRRCHHIAHSWQQSCAGIGHRTRCVRAADHARVRLAEDAHLVRLILVGGDALASGIRAGRAGSGAVRAVPCAGSIGICDWSSCSAAGTASIAMQPIVSRCRSCTRSVDSAR